MRAFINNSKMSAFMQAADVFSKNKVVYQDVELGYEVDDKPLEDEESILYLAIYEFGDDLILLCGKDKPLHINPNIQVLSNGKGWIRLIDILNKLYPKLEFEHDNYFTNIKLKS